MDEPQSEVVAANTRCWGESGGRYSADRLYRWSYEQTIGEGPTTICWIGLNPGTGDREGRYRPTLQRMVDRSIAMGMARIVLVNLFAWRATKPAELRRQAAAGVDVIGDECDAAIRRAAKGSVVVVAAWGNHGGLLGRDRQVVSMVRSLKCVGTTMKGAPRHPLYVRSDQPLEPYEGG